jgi:flagellar motility protein MotE (MotC chaperone)
LTKWLLTDIQERITKLKLIIISGILAFILSVVATMFFTGTFKSNKEQLETVENTTQAKNDTINKNIMLDKNASNNDVEQKKTDLVNHEASMEDTENDIEQVDTKQTEALLEKIETKNPKDSKESETKYEQLAKVYSAMKAENAASVMCELEPNLTQKILSKMNERTAGKLMNAIADKDPSYAAKVSKLLVSMDKG